MPAQADGTAGSDGPYAVLAGGAALVDHDCGFYFDCEQATVGLLRAGVGWRSGPWTRELWLLRLADVSVGDAWVARRLKLSAVGAVFAWNAVPPGASGLQGRLGLLAMRHERTDDGVKTSLAPLAGLAWTTDLRPGVRLELAWDLTRADGNQVSTTLLQFVTAGVQWRF